jgi:hypothetical protein
MALTFGAAIFLISRSAFGSRLLAKGRLTLDYGGTYLDWVFQPAAEPGEITVSNQTATEQLTERQ